MNTLRRIHLYLGCVFAPLLTFFAISGTWQTLGLTWDHSPLALLSTIHMSRGLKRPPGALYSTLTSPGLRLFVLIMALSLVTTIVLGVIMAFRFGRGRIVILCLGAGFAIPAVFVLRVVLQQQ